MNFEKPRRWARAAFIGGLAALALAAWLVGARLLFLRDSRIAPGQAAAVDSKQVHSVHEDRRGRSYDTTTTLTKYLVHYEVDGRLYTLETEATGSLPAHLDVRYAVSDPGHAELASPPALGFFVPLVLGSFGAMLAFHGRRRLRGHPDR